ncbi:GNAT family N-acetyltransferase [Novosphingobium aquimarinum]|uniref:GNAT family N-acetyltransferase n=1 Tax=Novosphingobium aquimarinum TaxID=2682494 RepID=UPI0018DD442F|nr:GNAT family N-acetyltransferase [Novosphingobium aquimarinum]
MFIRSERLFLRPRWPEDAPALENLTGRDRQLDPMAVVFDSVDPDDRRSVGFLITLPGRGIVGIAALVRVDDEAELRIWVGPAWRNLGYETEVISALAGVARMLGHHRIRASIMQDKRVARIVLDRTGFAPNKAGDPQSIGPLAA